MHAHANSRNCKSSRDVFEADSDDANVLLLMLVVSYSAPILSRFVAASASACCRAVSRSPRLHVPTHWFSFIVKSIPVYSWTDWTDNDKSRASMQPGMAWVVLFLLFRFCQELAFEMIAWDITVYYWHTIAAENGPLCQRCRVSNGQVKPPGFFPAHELSREKGFRAKLLKLLTIHEEAELANKSSFQLLKHAETLSKMIKDDQRLSKMIKDDQTISNTGLQWMAEIKDKLINFTRMRAWPLQRFGRSLQRLGSIFFISDDTGRF